MDLRWMEDFCSLCSTGNFHRSSKERNLSQPAFSRRIKALETWLGVELVDRSTFPARLTEAGREFRPVAEQMVHLAYRTRNELRASARNDAAVLSFACLDSLAGNYLPRWLQRLERHTGFINSRVLTAFASAEAFLAALEEGACDFLVCYHDDGDAILIDPIDFPSLTLDTEIVVPVVAADADVRKMIDPVGAAARPLPLLQYAAHTYLGRIVRDHIRRHHLETAVDVVYESSIASSLKEMALLGYGLAWLPKSCIEPNLADGSLVQIGVVGKEIRLDIKIFRHIDRRDKQVERFWSALESLSSMDVINAAAS